MQLLKADVKCVYKLKKKAVFCNVCSFAVFVADATGDHMVEA